jgi:hypothetical protein
MTNGYCHITSIKWGLISKKKEKKDGSRMKIEYVTLLKIIIPLAAFAFVFAFAFPFKT